MDDAQPMGELQILTKWKSLLNKNNPNATLIGMFRDWLRSYKTLIDKETGEKKTMIKELESKQRKQAQVLAFELLKEMNLGIVSASLSWRLGLFSGSPLGLMLGVR